MKLKGKVALVTGAAQGIGYKIALTLAENGANIVITDVNLQKIKKVEEEIREKGNQALAFKMDVTNLEEVDDVVQKVLDKFTTIHILVNNAGITKDNLILKMTEEEWDTVIDVNLKGTFNCSKVVSKVMIRQREGVIVNISSIVGIMGNKGQANYSASKAGIIGLTKTLALELASRKIRVNAIAPGFIDTMMTQKLSDEARNNLISQIPLQQLGTPENVANLVLFLASPESNYITGQVICVDGGLAI